MRVQRHPRPPAPKPQRGLVRIMRCVGLCGVSCLTSGFGAKIRCRLCCLGWRCTSPFNSEFNELLVQRVALGACLTADFGAGVGYAAQLWKTTIYTLWRACRNADARRSRAVQNIIANACNIIANARVEKIRLTARNAMVHWFLHM